MNMQDCLKSCRSRDRSADLRIFRSPYCLIKTRNPIQSFSRSRQILTPGICFVAQDLVQNREDKGYADLRISVALSGQKSKKRDNFRVQ